MGYGRIDSDIVVRFCIFVVPFVICVKPRELSYQNIALLEDLKK